MSIQEFKQRDNAPFFGLRVRVPFDGVVKEKRFSFAKLPAAECDKLRQVAQALENAWLKERDKWRRTEWVLTRSKCSKPYQPNVRHIYMQILKDERLNVGYVFQVCVEIRTGDKTIKYKYRFNNYEEYLTGWVSCVNVVANHYDSPCNTVLKMLSRQPSRRDWQAYRRELVEQNGWLIKMHLLDFTKAG